MPNIGRKFQVNNRVCGSLLSALVPSALGMHTCTAAALLGQWHSSPVTVWKQAVDSCGQLLSGFSWKWGSKSVMVLYGVELASQSRAQHLGNTNIRCFWKLKRSSPLPTKAVHFRSCDNLNSFKKKSRFSMLNSGFEEEMIRLPEKGRCTKEGSKVTGKQHFGGGKTQSLNSRRMCFVTVFLQKPFCGAAVWGRAGGGSAPQKRKQGDKATRREAEKLPCLQPQCREVWRQEHCELKTKSQPGL